MRAIFLYDAACVAAAALISCAGPAVSGGQGRTVTVAQTGTLDVTGYDEAGLQTSARMMRPGDTLSIGSGTYEMNNSLFVHSGVTVRGVPGQTILHKRRGVENALAEDGDYGERALLVAEPEK